MHRAFPEKRIFLKSGARTRFVRIGARQQVVALIGGSAMVVWTAAATAFLVVGLVQSDNVRVQAERNQAMYEARLNEIARDRDLHRAAATEAQAQFARALDDVSGIQEKLFSAELQVAELERGTGALRGVLRDTISERDTAQERLAALSTEIQGGSEDGPTLVERLEEAEATLAYLSGVLGETSEARDDLQIRMAEATAQIDAMHHDARLTAERTDRILGQLEEAVSVSMAPLDDMFRNAGFEPEKVLSEVTRDYAGEGGPLMPIALSTKGGPPDADSLRANSILASMEELNNYRVAIEKIPFAQPVHAAVRRTSGFGYRRDPIRGGRRLHAGVDWAGAYGTPIFSTAEGVVTQAGWQSGYGRLVTVQHAFGLETRYAHLSKISVSVGQRVSLGDPIGAMGNSGRSTGTHLHYEVRLGGQPTNPMRFIEAARNVF